MKQTVTARFEKGELKYASGVEKGSRLMFKVQDRLTVYVRGPVSKNDQERLQLDLMRRCASNGVPVKDLRYAGMYAKTRQTQEN